MVIWFSGIMTISEEKTKLPFGKILHYKVLEITRYRQFRYDLVVDAITSWQSESDIRYSVNNIIHRGL